MPKFLHLNNAYKDNSNYSGYKYNSNKDSDNDEKDISDIENEKNINGDDGDDRIIVMPENRILGLYITYGESQPTKCRVLATVYTSQITYDDK